MYLSIYLVSISIYCLFMYHLYLFINHMSSISQLATVCHLSSITYLYLFIHLLIICISIIYFLPYNNIIYHVYNIYTIFDLSST